MRTSAEVSIPGLDVEAIQRTLRDAPVDVAVLYGSRARGETSVRSDPEVAVGLDEELSGMARMGAQYDLVDELERVADANGADVVPLSTASGLLLWAIREHGVLLLGSESDLDRYGEPEPPTSTHEERMAEFDEILVELERIV